MGSFYKKVYLHSWQIIRTNWHLLFFGLFIVALGLTGDFKALATLENEDILFSSILTWIETFRGLITIHVSISDIPILSRLIGVFFFFAIILVLAISSQGALIHATNINQKPTKKNNKDNPLLSDLRVGVENFWSLLILNILNKLVGFVFVAGVITPIIYLIYLGNAPAMANLLISTVIFFSFIPLIIIISLVTRYSASYVIIKKQSVIQSFFSGWRLFHVNWIISLENALLLTLLTGLYTIAIIGLLAFVITPFLIIAFIVLQISVVGFWVMIFAGSLTTIVIFILAAALYGAYYTIVWTEVFLKLAAKGKSYSKTERMVKKHVPILDR